MGKIRLPDARVKPRRVKKEKPQAKKQNDKKVESPETKNQDVDLVSKLEELCIEIFAHCDMDRNVGIAGNTTNSFEAANVAHGVLDIMHGDSSKWRHDNQKRIDDYIAEWHRVREENH
jgi:hypothetical protein